MESEAARMDLRSSRWRRSVERGSRVCNGVGGQRGIPDGSLELGLVSVGGQRGILDDSPRLAVASKDVERCVPDGSPELAVVTVGEEPWIPVVSLSLTALLLSHVFFCRFLDLTVARLLRQSVDSE